MVRGTLENSLVTKYQFRWRISVLLEDLPLILSRWRIAVGSPLEDRLNLNLALVGGSP